MAHAASEFNSSVHRYFNSFVVVMRGGGDPSSGKPNDHKGAHKNVQSDDSLLFQG
jgi:hypothetical protein